MWCPLPWNYPNCKVNQTIYEGEMSPSLREGRRTSRNRRHVPVFQALNGLPGPYIKCFLTKLGHDGLNNLLAAYKDKGAVAQCIFALRTEKNGEILLFKGTTPGTIVPARGPHNFGWDPIFQPEGFDKTYAEMDSVVKNSISHRSKALSALKEYLLASGSSATHGLEVV
eukprot:Em0005g128a